MERRRVLILIPIFRNFAPYHRIPEGLLRLKKYLEKKGIPVDVAACQMGTGKIEGWAWLSESGIITGEGRITGLGDYLLIAISITSEGITTAVTPMKKFLAELGEKAPAVPFVAGGFGVWELGFQALGKYGRLDLAVNRWGEIPLEFLAKQAEKHGLQHPLGEREFKTIFLDRFPPKGIFVKYLRKGITSVRATGGWENIPQEALFVRHEKKDVLEISTQLGCAYGKCGFCEWGRHTEWKQLPADWVMQSIAESDPAEVRIFDACFLYKGAKKSREILERIKNSGNKIALTYECRADAFQGDCKELVKLMEDAGTKLAYLGFESGSEKVLREFKKGNARGWLGESPLLGQNVNAIDALSTAKFECGGHFILSSPNSELSDGIRTLELIAYFAKAKPGCQISTNAGVFRSNKRPLCLEGDGEGTTRHLWPQDPLAEKIAIEAHLKLARRFTGTIYAKYTNRTTPVALKELNRQIEQYLDIGFLEDLADRRALEKSLEGEFGDKLADRKLRESLKDTDLRIWKEYVMKGKHRTEFMEAARRENLKLERMLETSDVHEARGILLGKHDARFDALARAGSRHK